MGLTMEKITSGFAYCLAALLAFIGALTPQDFGGGGGDILC